MATCYNMEYTDSIVCRLSVASLYILSIYNKPASQQAGQRIKILNTGSSLFPALAGCAQIFIPERNGILENFCSIQSLFSNANDIIL